MKHVLGMSKRCLNLNGANAQKVELDYLRLVYVVKELRRSKHEAKGYLLVMTPAIATRVERWQTKYNAGDTVTVLTARLTPEQLSTIESEVRTNTEGMVAGTIGEDVAGRADATQGSQIAEQLLLKLVEESEMGVSRQLNEREFPFGIRWDYYGISVVA